MDGSPIVGGGTDKRIIDVCCYWLKNIGDMCVVFQCACLKKQHVMVGRIFFSCLYTDFPLLLAFFYKVSFVCNEH